MSYTQAILYKSKLLKNGEYPIMIRLIKDPKIKYLSVGHSCTEELWDFNKQRPKKKHPKFIEPKFNIEKKENEAKMLLLKLENEQIYFSLDEFQQKYRSVNKQFSFYTYLDELVQKLIDTNRVGYNTELVTLYWNVGEYVSKQVAAKVWGNRQIYGRAIFELLRKQVEITSQSLAFTKIDEEPLSQEYTVRL